MSPVEIPLTTLVDNTNGWSTNAASHASRDRSIYLRFERPSESSSTATYTVTAVGDALKKYSDIGAGLLEGELTVDPASLHEVIVEVQGLWRDRVVGRRELTSDGESWFPFGDAWDLSQDETADSRLSEVARPLAEGGYKLFQLLFCVGNEGLRKIGHALTTVLQEGKQIISVQSDCLFAPWWMLYTPPPGHDDFDVNEDQLVPWEGFWGISHIVEHNFKHSPGWKPCIVIDEQGITAGVNVDFNLDEEFPAAPCVAPVISMFRSNSATAIVRDTKKRLAQAIKSAHYSDHVLYFGCHGTGVSAAAGPAQAYLILTDREPIRSTDFIAWLKQAPLGTTPMVFINACQGGQMSSLFYTSVGNALVAYGANCVIGPQIDVPPACAREYANSFFSNFRLMPASGMNPVRAGDVFQRLAQEGVLNRKNPICLVMSLYRGIDSHFCPPGTTADNIR
jgi:hypothetical protein